MKESRSIRSIFIPNDCMLGLFHINMPYMHDSTRDACMQGRWAEWRARWLDPADACDRRIQLSAADLSDFLSLRRALKYGRYRLPESRSSKYAQISCKSSCVCKSMPGCRSRSVDNDCKFTYSFTAHMHEIPKSTVIIYGHYLQSLSTDCR